MSVTPDSVDERSIFSYTPSIFIPSAEEIVAQNIAWQKVENISPVFGYPTDIYCTLPDGIKIENRPRSNGESDYGLYATKFFKKHTTVFKEKGFRVRCELDNYKLIIDPDGTEHRMHADIVRVQNGDYKLIINPDGTEYQLNVYKHTLLLTEDIGLILTFSAFINHSCDPNGIGRRMEKNNEYVILALRDIEPNDEITLDYCLSEYDLKGFIEQCYCQAPSCRGSCEGFRYLSDYEKEKLFPYVILPVQIRHLMENKKIEPHQHDESEQHQSKNNS